MTGDPLILGFDTSAAHCAAALLGDGRILASAHEEMVRGQSERLVPMLEEILAEAGATWRDLAALGVGIGPGNFTGIRIAVATARGLSLSLGIPAVGVSAFEALAFGAGDGSLLTSVDARQGRVYLQPFDAGRPAEEPQIVDLNEVPPDMAKRGLTVIGAGADAIARRLGAEARPPLHPVAEAIARLAAERYRSETHRPAPLYIRPADAAPSRDAPPVILP